MADKEERILISVIPNDVCVHQGQKISMEKGLETICYKKTSGICNKKRCKIKQFAGMTRQDVIEKMAKAICKSDGICKFHDCENCAECSGNDMLVAEICLNALLGVEK